MREILNQTVFWPCLSILLLFSLYSFRSSTLSFLPSMSVHSPFAISTHASMKWCRNPVLNSQSMTYLLVITCRTILPSKQKVTRSNRKRFVHSHHIDCNHDNRSPDNRCPNWVWNTINTLSQLGSTNKQPSHQLKISTTTTKNVYHDVIQPKIEFTPQKLCSDGHKHTHK